MERIAVHGVTGRDRGAVVVLLALAMVVLMTFAAFAVDYGAITNERRRAQTAADTGALAGGEMLVLGHGRTTAVDDVIALTYDNIRPDLTPAEWRQRWQTDCTDPDRPAGYIASTFTPCISFNAFDTRVRVKLPVLTVPTTFARVIGIDQLDTTAFAEAELVPTGFGRVIPFGVPAVNAGAVDVCLKSNSLPQSVLPCTGPDQGNFGSVDISLYGNPALGTPEICGNAAPNLKLPANMILGTDHPLDEYGESPPDPLDPSPETVRNDFSLCPDLGARPNEVWAQPGIGSNLDEGMVSGIDLDGKTLGGRLTLGSQTKRLVRNGAPPLDDRPLWEYISTTLAPPDIPASCLRSSFTGTDANKERMKQCLVDYKAGAFTTAMFTADDDNDLEPDILQTPRYGFVPRLHPHVPSGDTTFHTGTDRYRIAEFVPVFIQTVYMRCNASGCDVVFDPGEVGLGIPAQGNRRTEALTAFTLPRAGLPPVALETAPGGLVQKELALRR